MDETVLLLPWGDVFEDWLDPLGVTPEVFRDEFAGSWMFGYVDALRSAGVGTVLACFTSRVSAPVRWTHEPTGAVLHLVPTGRAHAQVSKHMLREPIGDDRSPARIGGAALRNVAPYLATPIRTLVRLVHRENCAAILCQEYETPRFDAAILAGALARRPVFACFQGGDYHVSRLEKLVRPMTVRRAEGLIVAAASEIARVRERYGLAPERIFRIFNAIDIDAWRPADRDEARAELGVAQASFVAAWHGQLQMHRKGLDLLLDAWAEVERSRPTASAALLLVGDGADAPEIRQRMNELALDSVTLVDGWVNDRDRISRVLSAADVYVFASRHEGFPLAPLEAMACGLPIVTTGAQGLTDIVADGPAHGGVVVPAEDPRALARALEELASDEARRRELGRRARERAVAAFSHESVGRQLRHVLLREES